MERRDGLRWHTAGQTGPRSPIGRGGHCKPQNRVRRGSEGPGECAGLRRGVPWAGVDWVHTWPRPAAARHECIEALSSIYPALSDPVRAAQLPAAAARRYRQGRARQGCPRSSLEGPRLEDRLCMIEDERETRTPNNRSGQSTNAQVRGYGSRGNRGGNVAVNGHAPRCFGRGMVTWSSAWLPDTDKAHLLSITAHPRHACLALSAPVRDQFAWCGGVLPLLGSRRLGAPVARSTTNPARNTARNATALLSAFRCDAAVTQLRYLLSL